MLTTVTGFDEAGQEAKGSGSARAASSGALGQSAWADVTKAYAERLHGVAGDRHHVASPLGAWLLLATCSTVAEGRARAELGDVLGVEPSAAAQRAARLLSSPHPEVACGVAAWARDGLGASRLATWLDTLPPPVDRGPIPGQADLDAWASRHTLGLIERFPLTVRPMTVLLLASALATKVEWVMPFDTVPASELGPASRWSTELRAALRSPSRSRGRQFIAETAQAGTVGVHVARAEAVIVVSVIATEHVSAPRVLSAAHDIACAEAWGSSERETFTVRSLFELPLGPGTPWAITEEPVHTAARDGREEHFISTLPAWSARSDLQLTDPALGFSAAAKSFNDVLGLSDFRFEAAQSAAARYSATGFEAGAVTAFAIAAGRPRVRPGLRRNGHLRFGHPFAAVAVALAPSQTVSLWHGLPVFSAWVAEPEEAEVGERGAAS